MTFVGSQSIRFSVQRTINSVSKIMAVFKSNIIIFAMPLAVFIIINILLSRKCIIIIKKYDCNFIYHNFWDVKWVSLFH